ncbi:basic blue protein-like [Mercurialis annua]|uniref:basic blue protein-like n=1 Tax=Mercurialis annua TaxID=3986 RepID=UPI00215E0C06|nr:basic blue protein-like [Mercurialis annua]
MAAQGRGSAMVAMVVLFMLIFQLEMGSAAVYTVGGGAGWTFNLASWPKGKSFRAGDILVFNYSVGAHNVVAVNKGGYNSCTAPKGSRSYTSGKDRIKLSKGQNFFICTFPGHCQGGMKIAINAM